VKGKKLSYKHVLPANIIHMAENSRVHTGERLCKRGLQHALDVGSPDVLDASLTLARYGDQICILNVSMKVTRRMFLATFLSSMEATIIPKKWAGESQVLHSLGSRQKR
jgi:hypothetical protein